MQKLMLKPIGLFAFLLIGLNSCQHKPSAEFKILIEPLGSVEPTYVEVVKAQLEKYYQMPVVIGAGRELPEQAFINQKSPRYRADSILKFLKSINTEKNTIILGLTESDISVTKRDVAGRIKHPEWKYKDWGVMGLAYSPGTECVVSTFRIKNSSDSLVKQRLRKVATHEVGHNFGLPHCTQAQCVMQSAAEQVKTVDGLKTALCETCRRRIK